jgi:curli biogenesis system outer membrane secretion channel CsgG
MKPVRNENENKEHEYIIIDGQIVDITTAEVIDVVYDYSPE